jgi:hypothetical protein
LTSIFYLIHLISISIGLSRKIYCCVSAVELVNINEHL